ncbi:unnamed protein product [Spirodela intermedia]|uniref:Uncharacterized protein n=1 Tax=Spirodela intermedia TaxID=51605 RepID=A0A7I8KRJ3_SPIIN|nr:unnamed protein product [Spirodela intermedia]
MGRRKETIAEDYCFVCKEGGNLLICEHKGCLKVYHPQCVGKDESFLEAEERWTCSWHTCFTCNRSSKFQCFCCPKAFCKACIRATEFVELRNSKGFCSYCVKLLMLAEENADLDLDEGKMDSEDTETPEFLFMEYWYLIKKQEKITSKDLCEVEALLKKEQNYKVPCKYGQNIEEQGEMMSNSEDTCNRLDGEKASFLDNRALRTRHNGSSKRLRFKKRYFRGWGSVELIEFLTFLGKDATQPLDRWDVNKIIESYIHENSLLHPYRKKKTVLCDEKLHTLFGKGTVKVRKIYNLLEGHFASNPASDDSASGSEGDSDLETRKKSRTSSDPKKGNQGEDVCELPGGRFASMVYENIKLVYLRRSLIMELLSNPQTFERKVIGCFVRIKNDPKDVNFSPDKVYMLRKVSGISIVSEAYMVGGESTSIVLCASNCSKNIHISMLSDDDFEEVECEDLRQLVQKGLFARPTVVEFEEKSRTIHEDILNHWIKREISILQRKIERANEKGWMNFDFYLSLYLGYVHSANLDLVLILTKWEHIERRALLQTDSEQERLLKEIPKAIPDVEEPAGDRPNPPLKIQKGGEDEGFFFIAYLLIVKFDINFKKKRSPLI